jgi:hypothetical protein
MSRYRGLLTLAYFDLKQGDEKGGRAALRNASAVAKPNGIMMAPFWNRPVTAFLCAEALDAGIETAFVKELIRRHKLDPPASPQENGRLWVEEWPYPIKIYTLGRFEIWIDGKPVEFEKKSRRNRCRNSSC